METERPETREGFGEADLGEAQADNPPSDPEMIRSEEEQRRALEDDERPEGERPSEGGAEEYGGDQDAGPASPAESPEPQPDQAEG